MKKIVVLLLILATISVASSYSFDATLTSLDGQSFNISEKYGGKYLLVDTFATWCGPCKKSMPHLKVVQEYRGSVVSILSLAVDPNSDTISSVENFIQDIDITWDVAIDAMSEFTAVYQPSTLPTYFLLDKDGSLLRSFTVEDANSAVEIIDIIDSEIDHGLTNRPEQFSLGFRAILLSSFLLGVATSLSPCLFPMMPTYFGIVAKDNNSSRATVLMSVLVLGAGMFTVFATLGFFFNAAIGYFLIRNYSLLATIQALILMVSAIILVKTPKWILSITLPQALSDAIYSDKMQSNLPALSFIVGLFYTVIAAPCALSYFIIQWTIVLEYPMPQQILAHSVFTAGAILLFLVIGIFLPEIKGKAAQRTATGSTYFKYAISLVLLISGIYLLLTSRGII